MTDESAAAAIIFDGKGTILDANKAFCEMLNYGSAELSGVSWGQVTARECQVLDGRELLELCDAGQAGPWRTTMLDREGRRLPVLVHAARLHQASDRYLGVMLDATQVEESEQELRTLAGRLLKLYDEERRRIARELHDTTAQNLAALSMNLTMLGNLRPDSARGAEVLAECMSLTEECLKEVRSLSYMLHPPLLDELGLETALRTFITLYERRTGITVALISETLVGRLSPEVELGAFRIAQESLFNVHRHSGSVRAEVRLAKSEDRFQVTVRDWGVGISTEEARGETLGIAGMRERVRLLGGQLEIGPAVPGTLVHAVFRLEN